MNKFDWSKYDYDYEDLKPQPTVPKEVKRPKSNFDWEKYDTGEQISQEKQPIKTPYDVPEKTSEELRKMSASERQQYAEDLLTEREYRQSRGFVKGVPSGLTLRLSQKIPGMKIEEGEYLEGLGEFVGAAIPAGALTGGAVAATREGLKFEGLKGIEPLDIAIESAVGAGIPALIHSVRGGYQWIKSLNAKQQAQAFAEGVIPNDLTPDQYKFYEEQVVPKLFEEAQQEHQLAVQKAVQDHEFAYQQEINAVKSKHEAKLLKYQEEKQLSAEEFQKAQSDFQNEMRNVQAKHENTIIEIQTDTEVSLAEFEKAQSDFETMKMRNEAVKAAIQSHGPIEISIEGRAEPLGREFLPENIRPSSPIPESTLESKISDVV